MFGMFKKKAEDSVNKLSGRTDLLEAICAAGAYIAAADGEIEDKEVEALVKAVKANSTLTKAYDARAIDAAVNKMLDIAQGGTRVGKMNLMKEIREGAKTSEDAELVVLVALDVSDADGENEPAEIEAAKKIARELGVNYDALAA